jgi:protein TonB
LQKNLVVSKKITNFGAQKRAFSQLRTKRAYTILHQNNTIIMTPKTIKIGDEFTFSECSEQTSESSKDIKLKVIDKGSKTLAKDCSDCYFYKWDDSLGKFDCKGFDQAQCGECSGELRTDEHHVIFTEVEQGGALLPKQKRNVMDKRKTEKADLENKRGLFVQIGLVVTLAVVLAAFEWKTYDAITMMEGRTGDDFEEEMIIQTEHEPPPPPPPPPPQEIITELEIVADDAEIEHELEISAEVSIHDVIEAYVAPEGGDEELYDEEEIFQIVEEQPSFPGGEEARLRWLSNNIRYPAIARESGIQGTVFIQFVVERDGSITDARVVRGIGGGCDEEALRAVQNMPRWTPGKQRSRPVRVLFMMPVRFTLAG